VNERRDLKLIPDWPRVRQLVAKHLDKSEDEVQAMAESKDSLDRVELVVAVEEALGVQLPYDDS
jgi:acyl carrier protein